MPSDIYLQGGLSLPLTILVLAGEALAWLRALVHSLLLPVRVLLEKCQGSQS